MQHAIDFWNSLHFTPDLLIWLGLTLLFIIGVCAISPGFGGHRFGPNGLEKNDDKKS